MARIQFTEDALADLEKIDGAATKAILKAVRDKLGTSPDQFGDPLGRRSGGNLTPFRKLKVGQNSTYRVVYHVYHDDDPVDPVLVIVWIIAKRSDDEVYRGAMARIEAMAREAASEDQVTAGQLEQALVNAWQR
ncbi:MAG: type II toxin-antitoxin system RelE family toxin [Mycobacterium sp.]